MAPQDQFSGRAVFQSAQQRRPPMPPPAPPRAPAGRAPSQQSYASANPNASFQRAPTAMARPPMPPVQAQRSTAMAQPVATGGGPRNFGPGTAQTVNDPWMNAIGPVRTLPAPAPAAYANANPNASFQRPQVGGPSYSANTPQGGMASMDIVQRRAPAVTAADMVDVPGFGPMPRSLLTALQSRMQQRQQPPPVRAMPADNRFVGTHYGNDNIGVGVTPPGGSHMPIDQPSYVDRAGPYVPPAQNPAPTAALPPPPPPAVPLNQLAMTPNGQQMVAGGAANLAQQQATSPTPTSAPPGNPNDYWWDGTKGAWQYIDRAAEAGARNAAMVPPAPPVSPIAGHLWGGGPEAFGAGRSPVATSMTDFYGAFGSGIPGQPVPTQQQLYDRFNANPQNPYMQAGAVNNGNTVFNGPSWY